MNMGALLQVLRHTGPIALGIAVRAIQDNSNVRRSHTFIKLLSSKEAGDKKGVSLVRSFTPADIVVFNSSVIGNKEDNAMFAVHRR